MKEIINELKKFSSDILYLGNPIEDNRIEHFESKNGIELPNDFKDFMKNNNGIDLMGTNVYPFLSPNTFSLEDCYYIEHFKVNLPQWQHLVPFSPDGRGNFYCLDTSKLSTNKTHCPIVFWVSNYPYIQDDLPEVTNNSFIEWVQEVLIDWTLESYDYYGNDV